MDQAGRITATCARQRCLPRRSLSLLLITFGMSSSHVRTVFPLQQEYDNLFQTCEWRMLPVVSDACPSAFMSLSSSTVQREGVKPRRPCSARASLNGKMKLYCDRSLTPFYCVLLIMIRPMDTSIKVQLSINASFELEPTLGNGETLCISEISVGDLAQAGSTYREYGEAWRPGSPH